MSLKSLRQILRNNFSDKSKSESECSHFLIYILNIAFAIPLKHFGIFITTIFITNTAFLPTNYFLRPYLWADKTILVYYHLNRQKYPKIIRSTVSISARAAIGKNIPAITPKQNASAVKPAAFAQPLKHKLIINTTPESFYISSI